jgi:cation:H+ antiporter
VDYTLFIVGLVALVKGADLLVEGASSLAKKFGIPKLLIGLTVVAFGTSMPELMVNVFAAIQGSTAVAFGNVVGSNLANILLVLGIVAIIHPPELKYSTVWREIPFSLLATVVLIVVSNDFVIDALEIYNLTRVDGLVMLLFFGVFMYYMVIAARANRANLEVSEAKIKSRDSLGITALIGGGIVGLYFGGLWVVDGAIEIAKAFNVSEFMISASIVAIGTSLPELVTSVRAALKQDVDLALGNIIGSNIFNIFWILGVTAVISPVIIPFSINIDLVILVLVTLLLFLFVFFWEKHHLERWQGIILVTLYVFYIAFLLFRG